MGGADDRTMHTQLVTQEQADYRLFLQQIQKSQEDIEAIMATAGDPVPFDPPLPHLGVQPSPIHGHGLFTSARLPAGVRVCPVVVDGVRSIAARYINHSPAPNARYARTGPGVLMLDTIAEIPPGGEILIDYRQSCAVNGSGVLPAHIARQFARGDAAGEERRAVAVAEALQALQTLESGSPRANLFQLQEAIAQLPDVEMPLQHLFAPHVYLRTIFIPAGTVLVGKIHKHRHGNVLCQGHVTVYTEGGGIEELRGPLTMVSEPGTKRAVLAHTDTVWVTIHPTESTDLAEIEAETIAPSYEAYEAFIRESEASQ